MAIATQGEGSIPVTDSDSPRRAALETFLSEKDVILILLVQAYI